MWLLVCGVGCDNSQNREVKLGLICLWSRQKVISADGAKMANVWCSSPAPARSRAVEQMWFHVAQGHWLWHLSEMLVVLGIGMRMAVRWYQVFVDVVWLMVDRLRATVLVGLM